MENMFLNLIRLLVQCAVLIDPPAAASRLTIISNSISSKIQPIEQCRVLELFQPLNSLWGLAPKLPCTFSCPDGLASEFRIRCNCVWEYFGHAFWCDRPCLESRLRCTCVTSTLALHFRPQFPDTWLLRLLWICSCTGYCSLSKLFLD